MTELAPIADRCVPALPLVGAACSRCSRARPPGATACDRRRDRHRGRRRSRWRSSRSLARGRPAIGAVVSASTAPSGVLLAVDRGRRAVQRAGLARLPAHQRPQLDDRARARGACTTPRCSLFWAALLAVADRRQSRRRLADRRGDDRGLRAARRLQRPARRARGRLEVPRADDARPVGRAARDHRARDRPGARRHGAAARSTGTRSHAAARALPDQTDAGRASCCSLAGLATKIGWAPVHNWLPDAHSEAPPPISALLSAALLPSVHADRLARQGDPRPSVGASTTRRVFIAFGLASMVVAVPFLWRPLPWKRLLAYSSLEHMGIIALGIGFGTPLAIAGVVLHVAGHALAKALGFYAALPLLRASSPRPRTGRRRGRRAARARARHRDGREPRRTRRTAALAAVPLRAADPPRRDRRAARSSSARSPPR